MEFFKIVKGKFTACAQNQASFMRVTQDGKAQMVSINTAGLPRSARPLMDETPKGRIHVFDVTDKAPFSGAITVARPERAEKIAVVRERREAQRAKTVGNGPSITKGATKATKAVVQEEQNATIAATIADFFDLLAKVENMVKGGMFSAANEGLAELRDLANSVPNKQRTPLRNALRLLVAFKSESIKSDREKRRETVRHERTAKSAERAATIKTRRDGIAAAKANKAANTVGRGPAPFYTAKTGQAVARQLADARNRERAKF